MNPFKHVTLKVGLLSAKKPPNLISLCACVFLAMFTVKIVSAAQGYLPDTEKLLTQAAQSKDLYIEPDFNFQTYSTYTLELSVNDPNGQPAQDITIRIFSTDNDNTQPDSGLVTEKSLLAMVRTDQYGSVYQTIEISHSVKQVLLELNSQSPDNQVLIKLAGEKYISHVFEVD